MKQRKEENQALSAEEQQLCAVMRSVVTGTSCPDYISDEESFKRFFRLCRQQKVEAMSYMCMKNAPSFLSLSEEGKKTWHSAFITAAAVQRGKTARFLKLTEAFPQDMDWIVVKGIALRQLYPVPELRPSGDEDIYVSEDNFVKFISCAEKAGMEIVCRDEVQAVLHDKKSFLTLEVERVSEEYLKSKCEILVDGHVLYTLKELQHAVFLIEHAAEHFCHGGFGIRMLADIAVFIRANQDKIDADLFFELLQNKKTDLFAANMLALCEEIMGTTLPDGFKAKMKEYRTEPFLLLKDMMGGGIYGTATKSRKLAGRITSMTVKRGSLMGALFPDISHMKESYPILKKCILLLPLLYIYRLISYFFRAVFARCGKNENSGISLGLERLVLVKKYGLSKK